MLPLCDKALFSSRLVLAIPYASATEPYSVRGGTKVVAGSGQGTIHGGIDGCGRLHLLLRIRLRQIGDNTRHGHPQGWAIHKHNHTSFTSKVKTKELFAIQLNTACSIRVEAGARVNSWQGGTQTFVRHLYALSISTSFA